MSRVLCPLESPISDLLIRPFFALAPSGYTLVHITSPHKTTILSPFGVSGFHMPKCMDTLSSESPISRYDVSWPHNGAFHLIEILDFAFPKCMDFLSTGSPISRFSISYMTSAGPHNGDFLFIGVSDLDFRNARMLCPQDS
jgi:hypothetical protein